MITRRSLSNHGTSIHGQGILHSYKYRNALPTVHVNDSLLHRGNHPLYHYSSVSIDHTNHHGLYMKQKRDDLNIQLQSASTLDDYQHVRKND